MESSNKVYCVVCGSIVSRLEARQVFRTGFYKNTMPLAHCKDCAKKQEEKMEPVVDPRECHMELEYLTELPLS